jgi:hypothetical protein
MARTSADPEMIRRRPIEQQHCALCAGTFPAKRACVVVATMARRSRPMRPSCRHGRLRPCPGMTNHRNAERIHGFSDSALRLQDPFAVHAADIWRFLTSYELLVAHNAAFDLRFINREMRLSGLPALRTPVYCTMKGYRALHLGGSASLSAVCRHIKLARSGDLHDAIEDAWLAMQPALIQEPLISPSLRSKPSMTTSRKVHESLRDRIFGPQPCRLRSTTVSPAIKLASAGAHMGGGPTSKARKQLADFDLPTCEPMARNRLLGCSTTAAN